MARLVTHGSRFHVIYSRRTISMRHPLGSLLTSGLLALSKGGFLARLLEGDKSVPGNTDGIMMMGILIVVIIVIPIVWTRRKWMR